jgi:N-acetylglucosaminyldiphosphoundecaprenol N-acetyl-beta-D-mannosaminyltransferase
LTAAVCTCPREAARLDVLGVPIDLIDETTTLVRLRRFVECGATHVVHHLPADPLVRALDDPSFAATLRAADLNVADGAGVVAATRALGSRALRERVYGPDLMRRALAERDLSHGLMGGTPQILATLAASWSIAFTHAPPVRDVTPAGVAEDVAALGGRPDVLWVGLGTPKQQTWAELARVHDPASAVVTVGAAFDFLSGAKPQAPRVLQRSGLEWAFRLASEPGRLWRRYLIGNPRFVAAVLRQRLRQGSASR